MHVGEAEITAGVAVGEALVVDAEEVQDGGVDVVDIDGSFDRKVAEVVELTVAGAGAQACTGHPNGEAPGMMVAAWFSATAFGVWRAAKLGGENDERVFQQAATFQILQQPGDGPVDGAGVFGVQVLEIAVLVPAVADDLDEADAALEQAPSDEALPAKLVGFLVLGAHAVKREGGSGLLGEIGGLGHGILHDVGFFVVGDGGLDDLILRGGFQKVAVELPHRPHLVLLE